MPRPHVLTLSKNLTFTLNMPKYKQCSYSLRKAINQAKRQYRDKVEYVAGSTVNHGLQKENQPRRGPGCLAPRQTKQLLCPLVENTVPPTRPATKTCGLSFTTANVSKTFESVNPRSAADLDRIPSRVLRACADQLAGVLTDIFNQALSQSAVPTCFKRAKRLPPRSTHFRRHEVL